MALVINTNIASLTAQRNLNKSQGANDSALQRLSSGLRINSAKDDAAGLSIATRMESQIRGSNVAIRNASDAISLAQTAEGALKSITTNLQRIRELALQSANGSNEGIDRQALQEEVEQLKAEIQSISERTSFNGKKLLDGSFGTAKFQTGANVGDNIAVSLQGARVDQLGTAKSAGLSSVSTNTNEMKQGDLVINGISIGAADASADGASTANQAASAIAKAAAINKVSDKTGVTAVVNTNYVTGNAAVTEISSTAGNVTINGVEINLGGSGKEENLASDLKAVVEAINLYSGQTGVTASYDENNLSAGVTLAAADGRNISIEGNAADYGLAEAGVYTGTFTLVSNNGSDIVITSTTGDSLENAGIEVGTYRGGVASVTGSAITGNLAAGDLVINGVAVGATRSSDDTASTANKAESAIALAAAINRVSDKSGVTARVNATQATSSDVSNNTAGNITINGIDIEFAAGTTGSDFEQTNIIVEAINKKSIQTGVRAEIVDENTYQLVADDGRNIIIGNANNAGFNNDDTFFGSITLESGGAIEISSANIDALEKSGFKVGTYGGAESGQFLKDIDITTVKGAELAVKAVDNALQSVASQQAVLGAMQNRFDSTISNLQVSSENLSAAKSRIMDADFASETAEMTRTQVLQQAGMSILAQANSRSQQVLSLLQ